MKKLVLASNNQGKLNELQALFSTVNTELISQVVFKVPDVEEMGTSFIENALLKAENVKPYTSLPILADDSGLIVDALQGSPGLFSARYAGPIATDQENINKLLSELKGVAEEKRTARYYCALVLIQYNEKPIFIEETWEGRILTASQGYQGFGYDPVFFDPVLNCSAAELTREVKNSVSHRGKALLQLLQVLKKG
ncbi:MAG: non-canonical purine NTP pyrophosphatase, RdgB/HAM1 family [Gammaproteobacteria bacterium RIFCSPHIGHO2_12_FULL_35_23]|nr:MAG: non-canonical purine NTP pyrophosphatase, RdgB/HAM1 family [Gammaproteobacteria bacterium RIFCSPHIGHO2_12_FULL_35_23]